MIPNCHSRCNTSPHPTCMHQSTIPTPNTGPQTCARQATTHSETPGTLLSMRASGRTSHPPPPPPPVGREPCLHSHASRTCTWTKHPQNKTPRQAILSRSLVRSFSGTRWKIVNIDVLLPCLEMNVLASEPRSLYPALRDRKKQGERKGKERKEAG